MLNILYYSKRILLFLVPMAFDEAVFEAAIDEEEPAEAPERARSSTTPLQLLLAMEVLLDCSLSSASCSTLFLPLYGCSDRLNV